MTSNSSTATALPPVVAEYIEAVNALDTDRIVRTFADDAYVNDNRREIWGTDAITKFMSKEFVGDHVTMEVARSSTTTATSSSARSSTAPTTRPTCPRNWS